MTTEGEVMIECTHTDRPETALCVVSTPPRGAHSVRCPCCGLSGWKYDTDLDPMPCPDCGVEAVQ